LASNYTIKPLEELYGGGYVGLECLKILPDPIWAADESTSWMTGAALFDPVLETKGYTEYGPIEFQHFQDTTAYPLMAWVFNRGGHVYVHIDHGSLIITCGTEEGMKALEPAFHEAVARNEEEWEERYPDDNNQ
jgi:hypothetical protein